MDKEHVEKIRSGLVGAGSQRYGVGQEIYGSSSCPPLTSFLRRFSYGRIIDCSHDIIDRYSITNV